MRVHNNKIRLPFLTHCEYIYFIFYFLFFYSFLFLYFTIGETAGISSRQTPQVETLFSLLSLSLSVHISSSSTPDRKFLVSLSLSLSMYICYIPCCFHLILHIPSSFSWGVVIVVVWTNKKETIPHFVIQRRMSLMTIHLLLRL